MATMLPGVRPSISLASRPTASMSPLTLLIATIEGSLTITPFPFAKTRVLAVPRSMARSEEKTLNRERKLIRLTSPFLEAYWGPVLLLDHDHFADRLGVALPVLRRNRDLV